MKFPNENISRDLALPNPLTKIFWSIGLWLVTYHACFLDGLIYWLWDLEFNCILFKAQHTALRSW